MKQIRFTLICSPRPTLEDTPHDERVSTSIPLPIGIEHQPDLRDQLINIALHAAYFTKFSVFVYCPDVGLRYHPIALRDPSSIDDSLHAVCLYFAFARKGGGGRHTTQIRIYAPNKQPFHWVNGVFRLNHAYRSAEEQEYVAHMQALIQPLLKLLNSTGDQWFFEGFNPRLIQNSQITRLNKLTRKRLKAKATAEREQQKLAEKQAAQEAKRAAKALTNTGTEGPSTHGAGKVPGARPGVYKGVQMRSQLEIGFAADLDERGIKWVYEGEALGEAQYLVDFYLPEYGVWIEVKGRISPKDRQILPEVAKMLKSERKQRLLMYSGSGKCYVINPSGFRELERKHFWSEVTK